MKDMQSYKVQLVGNLDTVKRMVASLFLVNGKKEKQTLKVGRLELLFFIYFVNHLQNHFEYSCLFDLFSTT